MNLQDFNVNMREAPLSTPLVVVCEDGELWDVTFQPDPDAGFGDTTAPAVAFTGERTSARFVGWRLK